MATCPVCKSKNYVHKCMECLHSATPPTVKGKAKCEWPCTATIHVQDTLTGAGVKDVDALVGTDSAKTDASGFRSKEKLTPGPVVARLNLVSMQDKYALPIGVANAPITKTVAAGANEFFNFTLDPLRPLKVIVRKRHDGNGIVGAKVTLTPGKTGNTLTTTNVTTIVGGEALFPAMRQDTYKVKTELDAAGLKQYKIEKDEENHVLDMSRNPDEHIVWARLVIHLKLKYKDPDDTARCFPKDFPFTIVFDDGKTKDVKILDDAGYFNFEIEDAVKTKFTLKLDSAKVRYLIHEKDKPAAEVKEDPTEEELDKLNDAGKKFFALPKTWSLIQSAWDVVNVTVPTDGQIAIPGTGIGASDAPAELILKPKLQYVRFEFFDRKYCESDHTKKAVSIPPVVLKGARKSAVDGTPDTPASGTHDTVSNWSVDQDDNDKACQCLPWILTKAAADGADLPKLNNKMLLEFAREKAFVHSSGAKARKIVILPDDDAKRKPTRDRNQYYDLPKKWKSKCYFTRFSDAAKNKFFDELADADDADLEASYAKDKRLAFCLDDIVLVNGASQTVKDKNDTDGAEDLGEHSRVAILLLNPKDKKYNVEVYKPRAEAQWWSEGTFKKEAATAKHRNAILDYPINPRVVVFCAELYDVYDKRTETADFSKQEILGARAAKKDDTTITSAKANFNDNSAITDYYTMRKRTFLMHYLHYAANDGTTVYGMLLTMWTCRFTANTGAGGTPEAIKVFREEGMKRAMDRWNEKDYFFEEADDKHETVIKHFCLFEAKDVETTAHTFAAKRGGKHICMVTVINDSGDGSSAAADGSTMRMRRSGALEEGDTSNGGPRKSNNGWGHSRWPMHPPAHPAYAPDSQTLSAVAEYDFGNAKPACAFAHELGHGAIGVWDDYVTGKYSYDGSGTKLWQFENGNNGQMDGQRFYGMPFAIDAGAIMKGNRSTRVRYYWGRAKWLNDQAKAGLATLLERKRFRIAYVPEDTSKAKLKYSKPDAAGHEAYYKPFKTGRPYSLGKQGSCDLHLYHMGEDEFSKILKGGPYNGILAVCLKLSASFKISAWALNTAYKVGMVAKRDGKNYKCTADHTPTRLPTDTVDPPIDPSQWDEVLDPALKRDKIRHCEEFNLSLVDSLQDKFKLQGNGDFSTTYIRIFPQWEIVDAGTAGSAGTHFELEFEFGIDKFAPAGNKIVAGAKCKNNSLMRYMFGKIGATASAWPTEGGIEADLTKEDFPQIKAWMDANAPGRFNVGAI